MARVDVPNPLIEQPPSDNKKKDGMVSDSDNESIVKEQQAMADCNQKKMLPSQQQALQNTNFEFALTEEDFTDCNQKKKMLPSQQQDLQNRSDSDSIKEQQATFYCNQKKMLPSQQQALQSTNFEFALTEEDFTDCNQKKMLPSQQQALQNRSNSEIIKEQQAMIGCNQKKVLPSQQQALQFCGVEQNLTFQFRGKPGLPVTQNTNFEFALTEEDFASSENVDELEQQASSSAQEQQQKQQQYQYLKQYLQQQLQHQQHAASSSSSTSICFYPASSHEVGYNKQDAMWWKKFYELEVCFFRICNFGFAHARYLTLSHVNRYMYILITWP